MTPGRPGADPRVLPARRRRTAAPLAAAGVAAYLLVSARPGWSGAAQLLYALVALVTVTALVVRSLRMRREGLPWVLLSAGVIGLLGSQVALVASGGTVHGALVLAAFERHPWLGVAGLATYPLLYAGQMVLLTQRVRGMVPSSWLDGLLITLFLASTAVAVLVPVFQEHQRTGALAALALVMRPLMDLFMVAFAVANASLSGWRADKRLPLLALSFGLLTVCDALGVTRITGELGAVGLAWTGRMANPLVDAGRLVALLVLAGAAHRPADPPGDERAQAGWSSMIGPVVALSGALAVLVYDQVHPVSDAAVALALLSVVGVGAKFVILFGEVLRLSDSRRQARTDDLTGLANRRALHAHLARCLERVPVGRASSTGRGTGLLLLDLDRFKEVNDRFGHTAGDALLRGVAARLRAAVPAGGLLARLGGDEFAVAVRDVEAEGAHALAARLLRALQAPIDLDGHAVRVDASVGFALALAAPGAGDPDGAAGSEAAPRVDGPELLRRADVAMYQAKSTRSGVSAYDPALDRAALERVLLVEELRATVAAHALARSGAARPPGPHGRDDAEPHGLLVYYQPQVDNTTDVVAGVEALVRWAHPRLGLLAPAAFVELAEDNGLIEEVTSHVLWTAARQAVRWHARGHRVRMSVNLSTSSLTDPGLLPLLDDVLAATGIDPDLLVLEVTETSLMRDTEAAVATAAAVRSRGVGLSIDDYGTGYSSLAHLHDLPATELKLDRSFITRLGHDGRTEAIVATTVDLAHRLGLRLIAEGVEDALALRAVTALGCDETQGYLHSRPLPPHAMSRWLDGRTAPAGRRPPARADGSRTPRPRSSSPAASA